jgi:hypothetical protein
VLEPDLRRAEHVAGRVQAQRTPKWSTTSPYGQRLQVDLAEPRAQHAFGRRRGEVMRVAAARVVAVRVRDDGAIDRPPRVDVEIAGRAVQAFLALDDEVVAHRMPRSVAMAGGEQGKRIRP